MWTGSRRLQPGPSGHAQGWDFFSRGSFRRSLRGFSSNWGVTLIQTTCGWSLPPSAQQSHELCLAGSSGELREGAIRPCPQGAPGLRGELGLRLQAAPGPQGRSTQADTGGGKWHWEIKYLCSIISIYIKMKSIRKKKTTVLNLVLETCRCSRSANSPCFAQFPRVITVSPTSPPAT